MTIWKAIISEVPEPKCPKCIYLHLFTAVFHLDNASAELIAEL